MIEYIYPLSRDTWCSVNDLWLNIPRRGRVLTPKGREYIRGWTQAFSCAGRQPVGFFFGFKFTMYLAPDDFYYKNGDVRRIDVNNYSKPCEDCYFKAIGQDDRLTIFWKAEKVLADRSALVLRLVATHPQPFRDVAPPTLDDPGPRIPVVRRQSRKLR